jgi:hypothetical protein
MEFYTWACEAFERETYDIYKLSRDESYMAVEGFGAAIGGKIKAGWARLLEIWEHIKTWIGDAARAVAGWFRKIFDKAKALPNEISLKVEYAKFVKESTDRINKMLKETGSVDKAFEELEAIARHCSLGDYAKENAEETVANWEKKQKWFEDEKNRLLKIEVDAWKKDQGLDSFLDTIAMEAEEGDDEASGGKVKTNLSGFKSVISAIGRAVSKRMDAARTSINKIGEHIKERSKKKPEQAALPEVGSGQLAVRDEDTEKESWLQRILSRIMKILNGIAGTLASIPKLIGSLISKIFSGRHKETTALAVVQ